MFWIAIGLLLAGSLLYMCSPLLRPAKEGETSLGTIGFAVAVLVVVFAFGLYNALGSPDFEASAVRTDIPAARAMAQSETPQYDSDMSLAQLVERLEARLDSEPGNADGWMLYARSLMNLGRYDEALVAYETVLKLTDQDPKVLEEFTQAKDFAAKRSSGSQQPVQPRGPSAEDVAAAQEMSADDRNAMIENMVAGLSARLKETPNDPDGWVRLLRSRKVLGQTEEAKSEIAFMRQALNDPELAATILKAAGWAE